MKIDFAHFAVASVALHSTFFRFVIGASAAGADGEALVLPSCSTAQIEMMVREWDNPPEVIEVTAQSIEPHLGRSPEITASAEPMPSLILPVLADPTLP